MHFKLENLKEKTPQGLKKYFIYAYQFSFKENNAFKFKNIEELNAFLDNILNKYSYLDLNRLWYALYFETMLILTREYNMVLLENSIIKTLNQLSTIEIDFIETQFKLIQNICKDEQIACLVERPYIVINNSEDKLFMQIVSAGKLIRNDLNLYQECFNIKKIVSPIGFNEVQEMLSPLDLIVESWYTFSYLFIVNEILPTIQSILQSKDDDEVTQDLMEFLNLEDEEIENITEEDLLNISPFDMYLDNEIIKEALTQFLSSTTTKKRDLNLIYPIFYKNLKDLINNYLNS